MTKCSLCGSYTDVRLYHVRDQESGRLLLFHVCRTCAEAFFEPMDEKEGK